MSIKELQLWKNYELDNNKLDIQSMNCIFNLNYLNDCSFKNIDKYIEYDDFTSDLQIFSETYTINKYLSKTNVDQKNYKSSMKLVDHNYTIKLNKHSTIGIYTHKIRKEKIARYKAKIERYKAKIASGNYNKINYEVRKKFADTRTRIGGRFVKI